MKTLLSYLIKLYQACLSPFLGRNCRFEPTCSAYADEAIQKYGAAKGLWMGTKRLCKCHPYHKGKFYDPVP